MAGLPTWAAIDAGNLKEFPVLDGIETLWICADNDRAGLEATEQLAQRWRAARREVRILAPKKPGADFNDVVKEVARG